ncbi:hypothetical protein SGLAD_v1c08850 [Spiroplasma gladiatoris]|uniref:Uncharacterized protein n=1 Tax=Spiroplasma gladiatoris TaxID=2143 RepID=A0A4P7AI07_9MOLU|nr:hypothetical protein SGLAD_v1c08850 [Spiroplasma gladiatoris]
MVVISFAAITSTVLVKFVFNNKSDLIETNDNNDNNNNDKDTEENNDFKSIEDEFVEKNKKITFKKEEKTDIIGFDINLPYIKTEIFKYYFLKHFSYLGPKSEKLHLKFEFNKKTKPNLVKVFYNSVFFSNKYLVWNYQTKYI